MELEDIEWWEKFKIRYNGTRLSGKDYEHICRLHAKYFDHSFYKPCTCNGAKTIKEWAKQLDQRYNIYK